MIKQSLLALSLGCLLSAPAAADSLLVPDQANLFGPRPLKVGDLVTVSIVDKVSNAQTVDVQSNSEMSMSGPTGQGFLGFLGSGLGLSSQGNSARQEAAISRSEFAHTITARVVAVEGEQLVLEAHNRLELDGKQREVTLRGRVRRQDVGPSNSVGSDRVADAEVFVDGANSSPSPGGIMSWLLGIFR